MSDRSVIYLDHQAHAPIDRRIAELLGRAFLEFDANPHSSHLKGEGARKAVEAARCPVGDLIGAAPSEIIFTSGATEANNIVFSGLRARLEATQRTRVLVSAGEHPSVLAAAEAASTCVEQIPLRPSGIVNLAVLERMLEDGAGLVSVAAANHEIGTIQPLERISFMVRQAGALLHSDLAQAAGKIPVDFRLLDLASLSSHKLAGPVGIGALAVRRSLRRHLSAQLHGGGQEGGLRAGTVPAPLCVAFGAACEIARTEMAHEAARVKALRDMLLDRLAAIGGMSINGGADRLPGNINVSFRDVDGEALVLRLRDSLAISTGSACTSTSLEPSHVLAAIGVHGREAEGAIRISLGRTTDEAQIMAAASLIADAVGTLRSTVRRVA